jgi:hypothetical protein
MKINWGIGITVLYTGFVAMILVLVSMSIGQKIDLATEHYYEEELGFQDKIDKKERAKALTDPITWEVSKQGITIFYPKEMETKTISGTINLYCPSNNRNDRKFAIVSKEKNQFVPTASIPSGTYHLQIDWKNSDQTYWNEDVIYISHTK